MKQYVQVVIAAVGVMVFIVGVIASYGLQTHNPSTTYNTQPDQPQQSVVKYEDWAKESVVFADSHGQVAWLKEIGQGRTTNGEMLQWCNDLVNKPKEQISYNNEKILPWCDEFMKQAPQKPTTTDQPHEYKQLTPEEKYNSWLNQKVSFHDRHGNIPQELIRKTNGQAPDFNQLSIYMDWCQGFEELRLQMYYGR